MAGDVNHKQHMSSDPIQDDSPRLHPDRHLQQGYCLCTDFSALSLLCMFHPSFHLQICGPGVPISRIGEVCQQVAQKHKVTVVRDFIGHGVGTVFHADPQVFHHTNNQPGTMQVRPDRDSQLPHAQLSPYFRQCAYPMSILREPMPPVQKVQWICNLVP